MKTLIEANMVLPFIVNNFIFIEKFKLKLTKFF